jgi:hypothetical protein
MDIPLDSGSAIVLEVSFYLQTSQYMSYGEVPPSAPYVSMLYEHIISQLQEQCTQNPSTRLRMSHSSTNSQIICCMAGNAIMPRYIVHACCIPY